MSESMSESTRYSSSENVSSQLSHAKFLFDGLFQALDSGEDEIFSDAGWDQWGHWGKEGNDLLVGQLKGLVPDSYAICELGFGLGGASTAVIASLQVLGHSCETAVGVELIFEHCVTAIRHSKALSKYQIQAVAGDAQALPLASNSFDVVFSAGSTMHFANRPVVMAESWRVLKPGGTLIFLEEISLMPFPERLSQGFRDMHPSDVFYHVMPETIIGDASAIGFSACKVILLEEWAISTIRKRIKALSIFRDRLTRRYGERGIERLRSVLNTTLFEYERGTVIPGISILIK